MVHPHKAVSLCLCRVFIDLNRLKMNINKSKEFWKRMALTYNDSRAVQRSQDEIEYLASYVISTLKVENGIKLLDVCCGNGLITSIVAKKGCSITALDLSGEMLKRAKRQFMPNVRYVRGEASNLPFADQVFDAAYCLGSLHVLPSYAHAEAAIKELQRVTKPDGNILIGGIPWKKTLGYRIWNMIRIKEVT